jgi:hypothetical protein
LNGSAFESSASSISRARCRSGCANSMNLCVLAVVAGELDVTALQASLAVGRFDQRA